MNTSLTQALQSLDLEAGKTYQCKINDLWVELRVTRIPKGLLSSPFAESDIMIDPEAELPGPRQSSLLRVEPGQPILPDVPEMPAGG